MRRGEIWWIEQPRPIGTRPALLLSRDRAYVSRDFVVVSYVTTQVRGVHAEVPIGRDEGMPRDSVVNLDVLATIPVSSIRNYITALSDEKMRAIEEAIRYALDLPPFARPFDPVT